MRIKSSAKIQFFTLLLTACVSGSSCAPPAQRLEPRDMSIIRPGATAIVVVHSRSGYTASLGLRISEIMGADYVRLETQQGTGNSFFSSPNRFDKVIVKPEKIDLAKYRLVFLGSPIWYWNPAAFIYTFIKNNDLSGKRVVLFYTFQGGISKSAIDEWKDQVKKQGGSVIDVIGINRNDYKTDDALKSAMREMAETHKSKWTYTDK
jgi:flavodoxin